MFEMSCVKRAAIPGVMEFILQSACHWKSTEMQIAGRDRQTDAICENHKFIFKFFVFANCKLLENLPQTALVWLFKIKANSNFKYGRLNAACKFRSFEKSHRNYVRVQKIPSLLAVSALARAGRDFSAGMLAAIETAQKSIQLETYIYSDGKLGRQFLEMLLAAVQRGVRVRVLVDAAGSWFLPGNFFNPLVAAGAEVCRFNPLHLWRFGVRDHRKLMICDESVIFIGGFNMADEYDGDGVTRGWCDLGVRIENPTLAGELASSFEELFALSDFHRKPLLRLRAFKRRRKSQKKSAGELLLTHPGRGASPFQTALYHDLAKAGDVRIMSAYFLPTRRLRRDLRRAARRGARVQLILAGKSDVPVSTNWPPEVYITGAC